MTKFRKKPVVIEAVQWTGILNVEILNFLPDGVYQALGGDGNLRIPTLEGVMLASPGDWIIKGVAGEFYPCKPDVFEKTYEEVKNG